VIANQEGEIKQLEKDIEQQWKIIETVRRVLNGDY
jgi:hypothetical protein